MKTPTDIETGDLEAYLSGRIALGSVTISDLTRHTEGWSRLTLSFTVTWTDNGCDRSQRLVARVGGGSADERPHDTRNDIETEFRTMDAVQDANVPVPDTYWYEADDSILGDPFYLVEFRSGEAPITWDPCDRRTLYEAWDDKERSLPHQFVDATAGLHTVTADDVPFLESVSADEFVDAEIETYRRIYKSTKLADEPAVNEALRWFEANKPTVPETTLIHGDYRIGNMLVDDWELTAVLDWEFARIGDPMYDLGYASTRYFAGKLIEPIERPELACSLLKREWFYDEYEKRTGRTVDRERVRYWQAFSAFTMMTRGVSGAYRFHTGEADDVRSAWFQYIVPGHIEDLLTEIRNERLP